MGWRGVHPRMSVVLRTLGCDEGSVFRLANCTPEDECDPRTHFHSVFSIQHRYDRWDRAVSTAMSLPVQ